MKKSFLLVFISFCCLAGSAHAAKAKPFKSSAEADAYLSSHYNLGCEHYNKQEYRDAYTHFEKVIYFFPDSEVAAEASYYLGVCYFEMKEYDFANKEFSSYITASAHPAFFEDAVRFKFCIAEHFKNGKKRRGFNSRYLPKWISAQEEALTIYDEVIVALPNHEITICALRSKAELLRRMKEYRASVDTYQTLIRRFPRDEYTPECYLMIADVYCEQSKYEFQNPDILALAELNARKFAYEFPRDERVECVNASVQKIKENYARGLCDLGLFYERKHHPEAAAIYYKTSIAEFPDTACADFCRGRLELLPFEKEKKDVVVPISILREELDPLEYDEKATPAEGDFIDGLPQVEAPAIEATDPSEDYDQQIEEIVNDPVSYDYPDLPPPENIQVPEQTSYEQVPYVQEFQEPEQKIYYENEGSPYEPFISTLDDAQEPYPVSKNDVYEEPYLIIGTEEDNEASFHHGKTYHHTKPEEGAAYYRIVREPEPPPAVYNHYSLRKKRTQLINHCQENE